MKVRGTDVFVRRPSSSSSSPSSSPFFSYYSSPSTTSPPPSFSKLVTWIPAKPDRNTGLLRPTATGGPVVSAEGKRGGRWIICPIIHCSNYRTSHDCNISFCTLIASFPARWQADEKLCEMDQKYFSQQLCKICTL
jgi:hypothetical protein